MSILSFGDDYDEETSELLSDKDQEIRDLKKRIKELEDALITLKRLYDKKVNK